MEGTAKRAAETQDAGEAEQEHQAKRPKLEEQQDAGVNADESEAAPGCSEGEHDSAGSELDEEGTCCSLHAGKAPQPTCCFCAGRPSSCTSKP